MLTVCIPIYNFDVTGLVKALSQQAERLYYPVEIICIDDSSDKFYQLANNVVCSKLGKYIQLTENVGRAKIRNLFLDEAQFNHLLFLDCDSVIYSSSFLRKYIDAIFESYPEVICGGRVYNKFKPSIQKMLRWKYGHQKESLPVEVRERHPNRSFMTSNFVIRKDIFLSIKFDERLIMYGHEDTLFGYELKKHGVPVTHIDNPILNGYLEDNAEFIEKTEQGLINLIHILNYVKFDPDFVEDVHIAKVHKNLRKLGITAVIIVFFAFYQGILKAFLSTGKAGLFWFDLYKLGYFSQKFSIQSPLSTVDGPQKNQ